MKQTSIEQARIGSEDSNLYRDITIGEVVDTNDPQQMGRVRVLCTAMGDSASALMKNIPWATAMTPLGGVTETTERGRDGIKSNGPVAYGMWNIPKVGSHVLICCIDGDTRFRVWLGCLHPQFMTHTLPHGRYIADGDPTVVGPLSSAEGLIEPTGSHQQTSFTPAEASTIVPEAPTPGGDHTVAPEYLTRGADYSAASVIDELVSSDESGRVSIGDDNFEDVIVEIDGTKVNHQNGYKNSRVVTNIGFETTDGNNYDPQVYSWTTPGFHAIAMDDSANNCRIRLRTTHGNQIILDDTNERIYVSTPDGKTWLEMDEKGNIDVYAKRNISFHAEKDINFTAGDTFRVKAKNGIHLESDDEIRIHNKSESGGDFHLRSEAHIRQHSKLNTYVETDGQYHLLCGSDTIMTSGSTMHIKSAGSTFVTAGTTYNLISGSGTMMKAGENFNISATKTQVSGPVTIDDQLDVLGAVVTSKISALTSAISSPPNSHGAVQIGIATVPVTLPASKPTATFEASPAFEYQAYWTNRIPEHEPWARGMTQPIKTDAIAGNTHDNAAEFPYNSPNIGKVERGQSLKRNKNWHR